jgi:hypothetical protein
MKYARENTMSPEELAREYGISVQRLADLRSQGKGPPYFKFGGIWYPKDGFDSWAEQNMKGAEIGIKTEERLLALPVRVQGAGVHRKNRFGRHTTKQERRSSNRSSNSAGAEVGKDDRIADGDDYLP